MPHQLKILLLEDNPLDAEMIQRLLKKEKFTGECRLATNKKTFLEALELFMPDIIISDHSLPQFNSSKALELAREKFPDIPFIMVTGTVSEEFAANIIKQGADDYILKDRLLRLPSAITTAIRQRKINKEKNEAVHKLALSEEKYRTIFMKSPLPAWIYDLETLIFMDVNEAAITHYGYSREEFSRLTIRDIRPPETVDSLLEDIRQIAYEKDIRQGVWLHQKKNGEQIVVETTAHSLFFNQRNARMVVVNDVTEKKRVQEALQQSEENYRSIMTRVSDGFVAINKDWCYTYVNKEGGEIMGRDPNSLIGKNVWKEFPEGMDKPFYHAYHKAMATQQYIHLEEYYDPFDVWLENHIYPSPEGLSIFFRNITESKKAQQQLIESEENLKAIFDNSSESFVLFTTDGRIKAFNSMAGETILANIAAGVKTGTSIFDLVEEERKPFFVAMLAKVLQGETIEYDREYKKEKGAALWFNFSFTPVKNDNVITGVCGTARDITAAKQAERQKELDEQERLRNKMEEQKKITIAMLHAQEKERASIGTELHDNVNQILVVGNMMLSMIKNNPEKTTELVSTAMASIKDAIEENRKIAHIFVAPDLQTETLVDLLDKLVDKMLRPGGIETKIAMKNFRDELLTGDRKINIYRMAQEQCTNIIKYAAASEVNILLEMKDRFFKMTIADNGKGMDAALKVTGIGLRNINDRLSLFNGTSNIITAPGKGFAMEINVPL